MSAGIPRKIWITVFTGNSGLTHYSYCLARALHENGADVTLVTNENYELDFMPAGFRVIKLFRRSRLYPLDIVRFWRLFRRERPEIVHYQSWLKFPALELLLVELQKRIGAGIICTAHDWLPHRRRFYHRAVMSRYYRAFDRVVVHSIQGFDFLRNRLGVRAERLAVVPHGNYGFFATDPGLTRAAARSRLGLDRDRFWFLFFGRIDAHKGLDLALRALAGTAAGGSAAAATAAAALPPGLIIAGDPEHESLSEYMEICERLGLADRVRFFPGHIPVDEVQVYFRAADAVVLPYRESSTSGIAHLAMGFGIPVIATAVGGLVDVVEDGVTGLLAPPGDEQAFAGAMAMLAGDDAARQRLAEGWAAVAERYSWQKIAAQTMEIYETMS